MACLVRLPNWLGDVVMALPVVRAMAKKMPRTTLMGQPAFATLLKQLKVDLPYRAVPAKGLRYYGHFLCFPRGFSHSVLFANSQRSDLEAWLARIPQRFAVTWPGRPRRLINHRYPIVHPEDEGGRHQTRLWTDFTAYFSFHDGVSRAPLIRREGCGQGIVLICGSENTPQKRWPVAHWRALLRAFLVESAAEVYLTGTPGDRAITAAVAEGFPPERVVNLAGATKLSGFLDILSRARLVVGNDTGGLHLANAIGVPVIALFGPTNPLRTRPIYDAPVTVLQPPGCPVDEGGDIAGISPRMVMKSAEKLLTD